jgi:hypothetical protein
MQFEKLLSIFYFIQIYLRKLNDFVLVRKLILVRTEIIM